MTGGARGCEFGCGDAASGIGSPLMHLEVLVGTNMHVFTCVCVYSALVRLYTYVCVCVCVCVCL